MYNTYFGFPFNKIMFLQSMAGRTPFSANCVVESKKKLNNCAHVLKAPNFLKYFYAVNKEKLLTQLLFRQSIVDKHVKIYGYFNILDEKNICK